MNIRQMKDINLVLLLLGFIFVGCSKKTSSIEVSLVKVISNSSNIDNDSIFMLPELCFVFSLENNTDKNIEFVTQSNNKANKDSTRFSVMYECRLINEKKELKLFKKISSPILVEAQDSLLFTLCADSKDLILARKECDEKLKLSRFLYSISDNVKLIYRNEDTLSWNLNRDIYVDPQTIDY